MKTFNIKSILLLLCLLAGGNVMAQTMPYNQSIEDSVRYQVGTPSTLKGHQATIINHYLTTPNGLADFIAYTNSLQLCNLEAYNTFTFYLMQYYRLHEEEALAQSFKNNLVVANNGDVEISNKVYLFDFEKNVKDTSYTLSSADSLALTLVTLSGTTVCAKACNYLKAYFRANCTPCNTTYTFTNNSCNGSVARKNTVATTETVKNVVEVEKTAIKIYPNPAKSEFTVIIDASIPQQDNNLKMYNAIGVLVKEVSVTSGENTISIPTLPIGIYTCKVGNTTQKLVVQ